MAASFNLSLQIPDNPDDPSSSMTLSLDPSTKGVDGVNVSLVGNCNSSKPATRSCVRLGTEKGRTLAKGCRRLERTRRRLKVCAGFI